MNLMFEDLQDSEISSDDDRGSESDDVQEDNLGDGVVEGNKKKEVEEEVKKGKCTAKQLELFDNLIRMRISMQNSLNKSMQLPQPDVWPLFCQDDFNKAADQVRGQLKTILDELTQLQTDLLLSNNDTKSLAKDSSRSSQDDDVEINDDDDEEIPSDDETMNGDNNNDDDDDEIPSDDEMMKDDDDDDDDDDELEKEEEGSDESSDEEKKTKKRKLKLSEYPAILSKRHKAFERYRNDTIQKWSERTSSKGFKAFDQSVVKQIQSILSDRPRLVARTRVKRSTYEVFGKSASTDNKPATVEDKPAELEATTSRSAAGVNELDDEIFDDDDFYHQLLRELIHQKTSNVNDPIALSRQWLEMQKLRKKKRSIDTKASKGRRLRYDIHKKLVNYVAPVQNTSLWRDEQRDDLFRSLFAS